MVINSKFIPSANQCRHRIGITLGITGVEVLSDENDGEMAILSLSLLNNFDDACVTNSVCNYPKS